MNVTEDDIEVLQKLQELDRIAFRDCKALKALPQPKEAEAVHARCQEVSAKLSKVEALLARLRRELDRYESEDAQLRGQMQKVQGKIDADHGDYRRVETWTRDMQIMEERRGSLDAKMTSLLASIEEAEAVRGQAAKGAEMLKARERALFDDFNRQGSALKEEISKCQAAHKLLAKRLPADLLKRYAASVQRHAGVGLTRLQDGACEACRQSVPENRLPELRRQAPLAECPFCGRLMLVER